MTEPRKTPRTDGRRLKFVRYCGYVADKDGPVVAVEFAGDLEAETQELAEALRKIEATLSIPAAEYVPAILDVFNIIDKALAHHRAKQGGAT